MVYFATPASIAIDQCSQIDLYSCKVHKIGKIISLHKLGNPSVPPKTVGSDGLAFYYNPCSRIQLHTEGGTQKLCQSIIEEKTYTMISLHWLVSAQCCHNL